MDNNYVAPSISLYEIQETYFSFLNESFKDYYNIMLEHMTNPHQLASNIAYNNPYVTDIALFVDDSVDRIINFWQTVSDVTYENMKLLPNSIKAVFGGDLFPSNEENIASKCGIYTDTIVLPCPFVRCRHLFNKWEFKDKVYYLFKHALNVLQYRELALAEFDTPIVVVIPDKSMLDGYNNEEAEKLVFEDTLYHAKKIFHRDFYSIDDLFTFGSELDTVEKVLSEIKDPSRVLLDIDNVEPLEVQLNEYLKGHAVENKLTSNIGVHVTSLISSGRMGVCNELLIKSAQFGGTPLIDAPTSWEYFKWKLEYDVERAFPQIDTTQMHITKGLNGLSDTKLSWIGKIPPEGLIEIRKSGALNEIRGILSNGIDELVSATPNDYNITSEKVFKNLNIAFAKHEENISQLSKKKWTIAGKELGSWLVTGVAAVTAVCTANPLAGIAPFAVSQLVDAPKLKDLPKTVEKIKDINHQQKELMTTSPVGMMFKYKS